MQSDESRAHTRTHNYLRDIYAMQLFNEEKINNPLKRIDLQHNWQDITSEDRDVYRRLAEKLMREQGL